MQDAAGELAPRRQAAALLVVDMQRDFCLDGAPLRVAGALQCLPSCEQAVRVARERGVPVIWVVREHDASGIDVEYTRAPLFWNDGPGATVAGSAGAELVEPLARLRCARDLTIVKRRFSAFFHTHLDLVLRRMQVDTVVLCGVQTPNCIRATAFDAVSLDYHVAVLSDATASQTPEVQRANLLDLSNIGVRCESVGAWSQLVDTEGSRSDDPLDSSTLLQS